MSEATDIIGRGYVPEPEGYVTPQAASKASVAVLNAGIKLFEAAGLLRGQDITAHEVSEILTPAMQQIVYQLKQAEKRRNTPAIEKRASVIQTGPDNAADFIRAVNRDGAVVDASKAFRDAEGN